MTTLSLDTSHSTATELPHLHKDQWGFVKGLSFRLSPKATPYTMEYAAGVIAEELGIESGLNCEQARILLARAREMLLVDGSSGTVEKDESKSRINRSETSNRGKQSPRMGSPLHMLRH